MYNPAKSFEWEVPYSIVDEKHICSSSKKLSNLSEFKQRKYNVFSFEKLYQEFALIEKLSDVNKFVNKYGVLGLEIEDKAKYNAAEFKGLEVLIDRAITENSFEVLKEYKTVNKKVNLIKELALSHVENTADFLREVKIMRILLELISFNTIKPTDIESAKEKMKELLSIQDGIPELINIEVGSHGISEVKRWEHSIKALISKVINIKMKNVSRSLSLNYDSEKQSLIFVETWEPKALLGCLYTMLHMDLVGGAKTIICKHCKKPHMVLDNRETQLHPGCRPLYNTQKTRERMKKTRELYKNGVTLEDIYEILNSECDKEIKLEKIKKWVEEK